MNDPISDVRAAIEAGDESRARDLLRDIIKNNPSAEAYHLAAKVAYNDEQRRLFLERALELDPFHAEAAKELRTTRDVITPPATFFGDERKEKPADPLAANVNGMELADPVTRLIAFIIDTIILAFIGGVIGACVGVLFIGGSISDPTTLDALSNPNSPQLQQLNNISLFIGLLVNIVYNVYFLSTRNGQTPGKSAMKIRILKKDGASLTAGDAFLRNVIGYTLSQITLLLGYVWILVDKDRQGFHDKISNTIVVKERQ
jgi:uncharacterized RDD family membrane protein YckC